MVVAAFRSDRAAWVVVAVAVVTAVLSVGVGGVPLAGPVALFPAVAVVVAAAVPLGAVAAWGGGLGVALAALATWTVGVPAAVTAVAVAVAALATARVWDALAGEAGADLRSLRAAWAYVAAAAVGAGTGATLAAGGHALAGVTTFAAAAPAQTAGWVVSAVVLGGPLLAVAGPALADRGLSRSALDVGPRGPTVHPAAVAAIPLAWLLVGTGAGVLTRDLAALPPAVVRKYLPGPAAEALLVVFRDWGGAVQVALALAAGVGIGWVVGARGPNAVRASERASGAGPDRREGPGTSERERTE